MEILSNDILMKIITTITEDKDKQINELKDKLTKVNSDLEKEKIKIDNIKNITLFDLDHFCCDFCCSIYNMEETSKLYNFIEPHLCKYCEINPIYIKDILNATINYTIDFIDYTNNSTYYSTYNEIPKRYTKNPIFTIIKNYYDDYNKLLEDADNEDPYENAKLDIIQQGVDLSLDYRNNKDFKSLIELQRNYKLLY